jgi:hypothetical protein
MNDVAVQNAVISSTVSIFQIFLGSYVLMQNPRFRIAQAFFITMVIGAFIGVLNVLTFMAVDESTALILIRAQIFLFTLMVGGFLFLSSNIPFEDKQGWLWRHGILYGCAVAAIAFLGAVISNEVMMKSLVWVASGEITVLYILTVSILFASGSVHFLHRNYMSTTNPEARQQCVLLAFGIFFPIVFAIFLSILAPVIPSAMDLGYSAYLITVILFTYGILRFKMFVINPVVEERLLEGDSIRTTRIRMKDLPSCILVEERKPDRAFSLLMSELSEGAQGLVISRSHPDAIRERYRLERTPIIWLANQPGQDRVEPTNLFILENMVGEFIRKSDRAVVLMDGLEFLIANNHMKKVLKTIYTISDDVVLSNANLIISLDPNVMEKSEVALFERDFNVIGGS